MFFFLLTSMNYNGFELGGLRWEKDGLLTFICIQPLPFTNLGTVLTQFGKTLWSSSGRSGSWATMITGVIGSKNWYIQLRAREYEDSMAKAISDFYALLVSVVV